MARRCSISSCRSFSVLSTSPFRLSNLALMMPETMSSALLLLAAALSISLSMLSNFEITSLAFFC
jgi:hypothetical protein